MQRQDVSLNKCCADAKDHDAQVETARKFGDIVRSVDLEAWVHSIAWTPDGHTLAAATHDRTIRFWQPLDQSGLHFLMQASTLSALFLLLLVQSDLVSGGSWL
jgi:WD40 repeat protein